MLGLLHNLSPAPRRHWTVMTLPREAANALPLECTALTDDGRRMRAVRGRSAGKRTVYRVRASMSGSERVVVQLLPETHADAGAFAPHPWSVDDVMEMVPYVGIEIGPSAVAWAENVAGSLALVDSSPAHQRWHMRQVLPQAGLVISWWIDLLHDDPVAHVWGKAVWSDRLDPAPMRRFERLFLKCGELVLLDFAKRKGVGDPFPIGRDWAVQINDEAINLLDGSGLDMSGVILAHESVPSATAPDSSTLAKMDFDLRNLVAAAHGPLLASSREWSGRWLACGNLPTFRDMIGAMQQSFAMVSGFETELSLRAGWHGDRLLGLSRVPGQTGTQSDFGATKGTGVVTVEDLRHIHAMRYAAYAELLRGHNHYESNGALVRAENHPQWVTWCRITHGHMGVSTDRLGKGSGVPPAPWMHLGIDDEHMSHNYFAAYAMLADDPLVDDQLRHILEADRASYRLRYPTYGNGAARAQGRTCGAWAQLISISPDGAIADGFTAILRQMIERFAVIPTMLLSFPGPMRVPEFRDPDGRKPVYDPVTEHLGPWASMWELGLYLVGMWQAKRSGYAPAIVDTILEVASSTIVDFGFFKQGEQWFTVGDVLWSNGAAIPGGMVYPSRRLTSSSGIGAPNQRDVTSWTFAGLLVARAVLPQSDPRWQGLNEYVLAMTQGAPNPQPWDFQATTFEDAEWWAVVQSIA